MTDTNIAFVERVDAELPMRVYDLYKQGRRATDEDLSELNEMSGDELRELIAESLIDGDEDDWVALMTPPIRNRTILALHQIRVHLKHEAAKARDLRGGARDLRTNHVRIRRDQIYRWVGLTKEFTEVDHQAHLAAARQTKVERLQRAEETRDARFGEAALLLAAAIKRHKYATLASNLTPEPTDQALWAVLDRIHLPSNRQGQITANAALTTKDWLGRLAEYLAADEVTT